MHASSLTSFLCLRARHREVKASTETIASANLNRAPSIRIGSCEAICDVKALKVQTMAVDYQYSAQ
jgi:hypothetical protein